MQSERTEKAPRVSIGMPVYNGSQYIAAALDALLAQSFRDFELIISDNASTDETESICRAYAARDPRIRYTRCEENIGGSRNFDRTLALARAEYFMWAAHDDLWHQDFVAECVAALDANPAAVCCCTDVLLIDEEGRPYQPPYDDSPRTFDSMKLSTRERVRATLSRTSNYAIYGLMRTSALKSTGPFVPLLAGDFVKLLELNLLGPFVRVNKPLFIYRIFQSKTGDNADKILEAFEPGMKGKPRSLRYTPTIVRLLEVVGNSGQTRLRRTLLYLDVLTGFCFRNPAMRSLMGAENIRKFRESYRCRNLKGMLEAAPLCLLAAPDKIYRLRVSNEQQLVEAYRNGNMRTFLRLFPLYVAFVPGRLVMKDAWRATTRFLNRWWGARL